MGRLSKQDIITMRAAVSTLDRRKGAMLNGHDKYLEYMPW